MNLRVALVTFFVLLPWIFFGLDLGDQAYFSVVSWLLAFHPQTPIGTHPIAFEAVPTWFSFFVDSLIWKSLGANASLLSLRLAWIALSALGIGHLAFLLRRLELPNASVAALLGGLIYGSCAEHFVFTYNHLPAVFATCAVLCVALGARRSLGAWYLCGGVWIAFSMGARLPLLPLWVALLALFTLGAVIRPAARSEFVRSLTPIFLGVALGTALMGIALLFSGQGDQLVPGLRAFLAGVSGETNARYSKWQTLERLGTHALKIAIGAGLAWVAFFIVKQAHQRSKAIRVLSWGLVLSAALAALVLKYGILLSFLIGGAATLVVSSRQIPLAVKIFSVFVLFAPQMGTFLDGVQGYKYTAPLLVALAWGAGSRIERTLFGACLILFFVGTRILWVSFPFPDYSVFQQTQEFQTPSLASIRSHPLKVRVLDEVSRELSERGLKPDDPFLVFSTAVPGYLSAWAYLATRTVPLLHDPGLVEYPGSRWQRHREWIEQAPLSELPRLVLREKVHLPRPWTLRALWEGPPSPDSIAKSSTFDAAGPAQELATLLSSKGYRSVWSNGYFEILRAP